MQPDIIIDNTPNLTPDEDLFAQGEGVGELTACLTATIENIGATLAEVS